MWPALKIQLGFFSRHKYDVFRHVKAVELHHHSKRPLIICSSQYLVTEVSRHDLKNLVVTREAEITSILFF